MVAGTLARFQAGRPSLLSQSLSLHHIRGDHTGKRGLMYQRRSRHNKEEAARRSQGGSGLELGLGGSGLVLGWLEDDGCGVGGGGWAEVRRRTACWFDLAMEAWRDWKRRERRWSQGTGRPEESSRAAKRRKTERIQAMEESGPKPARWVQTRER